MIIFDFRYDYERVRLNFRRITDTEYIHQNNVTSSLKSLTMICLETDFACSVRRLYVPFKTGLFFF